jgi:hypothetical protein
MEAQVHASSECDQCVIKKKQMFGGEKIVFSCRTVEASTCSADHALGSVSCSRAEECNND